MSTDKFSSRCDQIMAFAFYAMIFFVPISSALVESFFGVAFFSFIIKRTRLFIIGQPHKTLWTWLLAYKPVSSHINLPLAMYLLIAFMSIIFSGYVNLGIKGFFCKLLEGVFLCFMCFECINSKKRLFIFIYIALAAVSLISIDGFSQYFFKKEFIHFHPITDGRVTSSFKHANDFGAYLGMFLPILLLFSVFFQYKKSDILTDDAQPFIYKNKFNLLMTVSFIVALICLGLTFSRAAWIAFAMSLFFLSLKKPKILIPIVLSIGIFLAIFVPKMMKERTTNIVRHGLFTSSSRTVYWAEAINIIRDYPLLGSGLNAYSKVGQQYKIDWGGYPHNCYLQMAAEVGLLGLTAFLWGIFRIFYQGMISCNQIHDKAIQIILFGFMAGMSAFLVVAFSDTNFYSNQLANLMWIMLGAIIAAQKIGLNSHV